MSLRPEDLIILEPANHGDSDIDVEVDELFGNEENMEEENERIPSEIFTQIDWDITNSVCEQGSTLANRDESVDTSCLIQKGMLFDCKEDLQLAVKKYCVTQHYEIVVVESNQNIWSVRCKQWSNGCNWRLRGSRRKSHGLFEISRLEGEHSFKADPSVTVSVLMEMIKQQYGTRVDWFFLPSDVFGTTIFGRVFWAFGPAIEGLKYCRPLIQIDGTHLYGKYKGKMLTVLSIDANGHIFPLAFAIVEGENASSWSWFLYALRQYVTDQDGICLISDRHRGILSAINNEEIGWSEPRAFHRYCLRHVASNFNNKYKSKQLKDLVFRAGNQHQRRKFIRNMKEIKQLNPECLEFFEDIDLQKWTQSHDNGYRYGWMTSNATECMNGVFKGARMLPMTSLVRLTFYRTILYFERRRAEISEAVDRGEVYTEYAMKKLKRWETRASAHSVTSIDRETQTFEVHTGMSMISPYKGQHTQVVSLMEGTCSCNKWQSFKIPCSHVIAVCNYMHLTYAAYIDECYLLSNFKQCYVGRFHPIQHLDYSPELSFTEVRPNADLLKGPGRPRTTRIHNKMDWKESSQSLICTICKVEGHNRRTCPQRASSSSRHYF
ncbi:uncharacterized protein E6C27_scaffold318G001000 [Cucumis melo var. makuwa]|uniref:SWIM-type domain-containing protein n=1 Tax=Cucumis melo var. makuwa TaxID=1194695 RepID=A0A5A7UHL3_CUCMM|nr:uncharacterized protein E6C27_scaffold318G001000 [Cucumis melo var. makuwa]